MLVRGWNAVSLIPLTEPWVEILVGDGCYGSVGLLEVLIQLVRLVNVS